MANSILTSKKAVNKRRWEPNIISPPNPDSHDVVRFSTGFDGNVRIADRTVSFRPSEDEERKIRHTELVIKIATFSDGYRGVAVEIEWKGGARPTLRCDLAEGIEQLITSLFTDGEGRVQS